MAKSKKNSMGMYKGSIMIKEDMSAPSLLPREAMDKYWPSPAEYNMKVGDIQDLFRGVQEQMNEDSRDFKKAYGPKKF